MTGFTALAGSSDLLLDTGRLLLGLASGGFGAALGWAVKGWLERRQGGDDRAR